MRNGYLPLAMVSVGEKTRLERICAGEKMVQRLSALGFTPGVELSIVQDSGGPILISCVILALLWRGMAQQKLVI